MNLELKGHSLHLRKAPSLHVVTSLSFFSALRNLSSPIAFFHL